MWQLKFEYMHKDCLYSSHVKQYDLTMYGYPLSNFLENGRLRLTGLQILQGSTDGIKKYLLTLKRKPSIRKIEIISPNAFLYEAIISHNISYYQSLYHHQIFYLVPIVHQRGKEIFEVASWDRGLLEKIMNNVRHNQNTTNFKLLALKKMPVKSLFLPQILPKLTDKQRYVLKLAQERGYWHYPRKTDLNQLAKELKLAKSTVHEIVKRAEAKLMDYFI